jgi:hypothetical protein
MQLTNRDESFRDKEARQAVPQTRAACNRAHYTSRGQTMSVPYCRSRLDNDGQSTAHCTICILWQRILANCIALDNFHRKEGDGPILTRPRALVNG